VSRPDALSESVPRVFVGRDLDVVPQEQRQHTQHCAGNQHERNPGEPGTSGENQRQHGVNGSWGVLVNQRPRERALLVGGLGDLLAAGARHDHGFVLGAVLPVVVHRQPGLAAWFFAGTASREST
jgi:hypothetical protein